MNVPANQCDVLMIRHGLTIHNQEGRIQGHKDSNLSSDGLSQAMAVAHRMRKYNADVLISSDLGRARNTAWFVSQKTGLPVDQKTIWRERCYGVWDGKTKHEIEQHDPLGYAAWRSGDPDVTPDNGESARMFQSRIEGALRELTMTHLGKRVIIVTHGGCVGVAMRLILGVPLDMPRRYEVLNTSLTHCRWMTDHWMLWRFGDVSHVRKKSRRSRR